MPKRKPGRPPTPPAVKQKFADRLLANREARVARRKTALAGLKKAGGLLWEHRKEILDLLDRLSKLPTT